MVAISGRRWWWSGLAPTGRRRGLIEGLAGENIYVAPRLGRMRISPHVYNDEADCDRFVAALSKRLKI
jgi:selenocysteine lyase/cysteine desulfurase